MKNKKKTTLSRILGLSRVPVFTAMLAIIFASVLSPLSVFAVGNYQAQGAIPAAPAAGGDKAGGPGTSGGDKAGGPGTTKQPDVKLEPIKPAVPNQKTCGTKSGGVGTLICNPLKDTATLDQFLVKLLKAVNVLAAMAVTFFIIYAGFQYVTAMGDEKKITSAHETLKWTVIGAAILFGAQAIDTVIKNTVNELVNVK